MQENNQAKTKKIILDLANYLNVKGIQGVAAHLNENPNKLYAWIKNGNIGDIGCILAKCPEISAEWLKTGEGRIMTNPQPTSEHLKSFFKEINENREAKQTEVYCLAGAGNPQLQTEEVARYIMLPAEFTKKGLVPVEIVGDSMSPVFMDGSIVGVDVNDRDYVSGKYYAVWMDDEGALVKKLSSEKDRIYVESLNKNEHSFYVDKSIIYDHFILGRVRWWINQDRGI